MQDRELFARILGLEAPRELTDVQLDMASEENRLSVSYTNAIAEMLSGKIQELKHAARGFRSFAHYRTHILFHLAGLDLSPLKSQQCS